MPGKGHAYGHDKEHKDHGHGEGHGGGHGGGHGHGFGHAKKLMNCGSLENDSVCSVGSPLHIICFILNIFFPGIGTIIAGIAGGCNGCAIIVGLLQLFTAWLIIGWIWSIWWGWLIFKKSS